MSRSVPMKMARLVPTGSSPGPTRSPFPNHLNPDLASRTAWSADSSPITGLGRTRYSNNAGDLGGHTVGVGKDATHRLLRSPKRDRMSSPTAQAGSHALLPISQTSYVKNMKPQMMTEVVEPRCRRQQSPTQLLQPEMRFDNSSSRKKMIRQETVQRKEKDGLKRIGGTDRPQMAPGSVVESAHGPVVLVLPPNGPQMGHGQLSAAQLHALSVLLNPLKIGAGS